MRWSLYGDVTERPTSRDHHVTVSLYNNCYRINLTEIFRIVYGAQRDFSANSASCWMHKDLDGFYRATQPC